VIFGLFKSRVFDVLHLWPPISASVPEHSGDIPSGPQKAIIK